MTSTTTRTTRIANHKIDEMFRELVPFSNYNASIVATLDYQGFYSVTHWGTELVRIDTTRRAWGRDSIIHLNPVYYSQTTSTLQGRILRSLLTRNELLNTLDYYQNKGDLFTFRRLKRMAGL